MPFKYLCAIVSLISIYKLVHSRDAANRCECLEYWDCITKGGHPYAYCENLDSKVWCCFPSPDPLQDATGILPRKTKVGSCGQKGADSGKDGVSELGEWRWHVAILENPRELYVCGGTLIDEYWVLTAAHCVDDYPTASLLKVRLGEHDVSTPDAAFPHEEFPAARVVLHPAFDNETLENDVALVRLATPARPRPHVHIVCLPDSDALEAELLAAGTCYITGWGRRTESSNHSLVLKEVQVPIWNRERCESALQLQFGTEFELPATSLCAGAEGRDACDGDGGGPLVCSKKSRWYQLGIISFGIGCGRKNTPGVYTRVQAFAPWIYDTVAQYAT